METEHLVRAPAAGVVATVKVAVGDTVRQDQPLLTLAPGADTEAFEEETADPDALRADLAEVQRRHEVGLDASRPDAVRRRRERGQRTARENLADLCDPGTFVEYGPLVVAAQRQRRGLDDLIARTPADGLVTGIADVNGAPCVVMAYDATVLAGTQGVYNHAKKDRMFTLAARRRLPVVLLAEGGGGRPGDTDHPTVAGLDVPSFHLIRAPVRAGPAGRDRVGAVLRRQRRAARLLRRGDRVRGRHDRHGRAGDDRGRRARGGHAGGGRAAFRAGTQRCRGLR